MPRDSNGVMSLPAGTLVNTGDTVLPSQHNPAMNDIAQALTNSVTRNGSGAMQGDLNMGNFRVTDLAPGVNPNDAATVSQAGTIPIGVVVDFWGTTVPEGFLFAAGQELSRTTYAGLFAVIGTAGGAGNGTTTFNLPDYRGRVGAGRENMATPASTRLDTLSSSTLGATGGAQTHTLTEAQMPTHNHSVTDPGHTHSYQRPTVQGNVGAEGAVTSSTTVTSASTGSAATGITIANKGGGTAHNNVQPTIICNKIIRVA